MYRMWKAATRAFYFISCRKVCSDFGFLFYEPQVAETLVKKVLAPSSQTTKLIEAAEVLFYSFC